MDKNIVNATVEELVDRSRASALREAAEYFRETGDVTISNILGEASTRAIRGDELFDDDPVS